MTSFEVTRIGLHQRDRCAVSFITKLSTVILSNEPPPLPPALDRRIHAELFHRARRRRSGVELLYYESEPGRRSAAKLLTGFLSVIPESRSVFDLGQIIGPLKFVTVM